MIASDGSEGINCEQPGVYKDKNQNLENVNSI